MTLEVGNRSLSPNTVLGLFLWDAVVGVVHVDGQVLVGVVGRLVVGDHAAGDAQQTHHCRRTNKVRSRSNTLLSDRSGQQ